MRNAAEILISPILSEKASTYNMEGNDDIVSAGQKKYVFRVAMNANKIEVKAAVESTFKGVEVEKVNIVTMKPKKKRIRNRMTRDHGFTRTWKKAIVTLKKGEIDFYK